MRLLPGEAVAATGPVSAGGEFLAEALGRLIEPASGRVTLDGAAIETLPDSFTGRRIGYAEANTYFPQSSLRDALVYGLRHAPLRKTEKDSKEERRRRHEAMASGNIDVDIEDDWIDYEAAGATGPEDLLDRIRDVLVVVDFENDVYRLGLRSRMPEARLAELESRILAARDDFRERLIKAQAEHYVEMFDPTRYMVSASVKENLIFGVAVPEALGDRRLEDHPYLRSVIAETGLEQRLLAMGLKDRRDADRPVRRSAARQSAARAHGPDGAGGDRYVSRDRSPRRRCRGSAARRQPIGRRCSASPTATSSRGIAWACSTTRCRPRFWRRARRSAPTFLRI